MKWKWEIVSVIITAASFLGVAGMVALAAPLSYTSNTNLSLISPATTLTIASGSLADALIVNATSVVATLSSSTGGTFTLTSASYDLAVGTSSGGGTVTNSCSNGLVTLVLSQTSGSATYTVTPSGQGCSTASAPIITNIAATSVTENGATITWTTNIAADSTVSYGTTSPYGATSTDATLTTSHSMTLSGLLSATAYHYAVISFENGTSSTSGDNTFTTLAGPTILVGGGYGVPYIPGVGPIASSTVSSTPASPGTTAVSAAIASSTADLEAELKALIATLCTLVAQARTKGIPLSPGVSNLCPASPSSPPSLSPSSYVFIRNLQLWDQGQDVNELQRYLVAQDSGPAAEALARHGTTNTFGLLTYRALVEFQEKADITPASGYFGPITRGYVRSHE